MTPAAAEAASQPPARLGTTSGRRLAVRVLSGAVLIGVVAAALIAGGWLFVALVALAAALGAREFARLAAALGAEPPLWLLMPLTVWLAIQHAIPGRAAGLDVGLAAALVVGLAGLVVAKLSWRGWLAAVGGAIYIGFALGFYVALLQWRPGDQRYGMLLVLVPAAAVVASDTLAFVVGSVAGRHRFFPHLSPRKSVEGAVAGLLGAVATAAVLGPPLLGVAPLLAALLGLAVGVAAQAGDLAESALKRQAGAKDAGGLIPGHGGLLDRLDSLLVVAPIAYFFDLAVGLH